MVDRIIFLGTGGGRIVLANQLVATGGFVIQTEGKQIWIDPGPGALVRAKQFGVRPQNTDIIFVSHHHLDHSNDLNAVIDAMTIGGIQKKGILISTPTTIDGTGDDGPILLKSHRKFLSELYILKTGESIQIKNFRFVATYTDHDVEYANGLKLETPKFTLSYVGNTAPLIDKLAEEHHGADILIMDVLKPGKQAWKTHFCTQDAINLANKVKPQLSILTHFGAKMISEKPIFEARNVQNETGIRTIAAQDGMQIDLTEFKTVQKKLT